MNKYILSVLLLFLFSLGYVFLNWRGSEKKVNEGSLPVVDNIFVEHSAFDTSFTTRSQDLPVAMPAKQIDVESINEDIKTAKTAWTFSVNRKTLERRLTPEEIANAPVVDVLRMNINNKDYNIIIVEKDGKTYDASDGVRIYVPNDFTEARRKAGLL